MEADANSIASPGSALKGPLAPQFPQMEPCQTPLKGPSEAPLTCG